MNKLLFPHLKKEKKITTPVYPMWNAALVVHKQSDEMLHE